MGPIIFEVKEKNNDYLCHGTQSLQNAENTWLLVFDFNKPCSKSVIFITPRASFFETPGMKLRMIGAHLNCT